MKSKILLATLLSSVMLTACTDGSNVEDVANNASTATPSAAANTEASSVSSEVGASGIRPDIEIYIKARYADEKYPPALRYAKSLQAVIDTDTANAESVVGNNKEHMQAMVCFHKSSPSGIDAFENNRIRDIESETLNTSERQQRYDNFLAALPSGDMGSYDDKSCG